MGQTPDPAWDFRRPCGKSVGVPRKCGKRAWSGTARGGDRRRAGTVRGAERPPLDDGHSKPIRVGPLWLARLCRLSKLTTLGLVSLLLASLAAEDRLS